MTTQLPSQSPLGFGLSCTFCSCVLPYPGSGLTPAMVTVTAIQPPLGLGTNPTTGALLPSTTAGRQSFSEDIARRLATARGTLPDSKAPTTVGNYGIDIGDDADADMTQSDCGRLAASIDAQCRQDERVTKSITTVALANGFMTPIIRLFDGAGPFRLTLGINVLTQNLQLFTVTP